MTRARTNSVFGEMISVSVPVTSCAESSSTDTLVSLGATPKATTRSAATTPPSLLTPVYHYQHPRHHMALSTVLGVFFGVLGTILLSLVIETRVGLHAIGDMTLPASTTTAPKSTSPVTTTAAPLSLTGCLTSVASVAVPLFGLGDSHGRDLLQSPLVRLGETHMDKERHWTRVIPLSDRQSNIRYDYHGTPRTYGIHTRHAPHLSPDTHILLSRGTWDLMKYSTPLSKYYAEVKALVRGAAATGAASVTFKTVHRFAAPTAELGFFAECTSADIVGAYRRVGACAVALYNHDAKPTRRVFVLDAWDATSRWPREAFADDGHHLVADYLHTVADTWINFTMCPTQSKVLDHGGIWISSDASAIEARFGCRSIEKRLDTALQQERGDFPILEQYFRLPTRPGCRCLSDSGDERVNDHCAFGRLFSALSSNSSRLFEPHRAALALFRFSTDVTRLKDATKHTDSTFIATLNPAGRDRFAVGEAALEMCVDPTIAVLCLRNLGVKYAAAFAHNNSTSDETCRCSTSTENTATDWCRSQRQRADSVASDLVQFLRFIFRRLRPESLSTVTGLKDRRLREAFAAITSRDTWIEPYVEAFLHVACSPDWRRSDRRARSSIASAALSVMETSIARHKTRTHQAAARLVALRSLIVMLDSM